MTRFEELKKNLTLEQLAQFEVKLCIVNGSEPYYVTTTGQLYPMNPQSYKAALQQEATFWAQEIKEEEK